MMDDYSFRYCNSLVSIVVVVVVVLVVVLTNAVVQGRAAVTAPCIPRVSLPRSW